MGGRGWNTGGRGEIQEGGVGYGREGWDMRKGVRYGGRGGIREGGIWEGGDGIREGGVRYRREGWDMGGRDMGYGREGGGIWEGGDMGYGREGVGYGREGVGYGRDGGWDDSHTPLLFMVFGLPLGTSAHSKWPISSKSMIQ